MSLLSASVILRLREVFTAFAARPPANLPQMRLGIGGAFAKCSACQGEDFYPAFPLTPDRRDVLVCARCENQTIYAELVRNSRGGSDTGEKTKWPTTSADIKTTSAKRSRSRSTG
jgi:hypothetical protein